LQRKDRNATGAQDEDRVAGFQRAIDDEGTPNGHAGRGERRSLSKRISFRRMGKCSLRCYNKLAGVSIDAIAWNAREIGNGWVTLNPIWEKA
jgi:hypothetical protein